MREYTIAAACSVAAVILLDSCMSVKLFRQRKFFIFLAVIFLIKLAVNGYLTGAAIVRYAAPFYLGIRLGSIPLEDFLFGFSMVTITVLLWEFFKKRQGCGSRR